MAALNAATRWASRLRLSREDGRHTVDPGCSEQREAELPYEGATPDQCALCNGSVLSTQLLYLPLGTYP